MRARVLAPAVLAPVLGAAISIGQTTIQLDPSQRFQVFQAWEATAQAGQDETLGFDNYGAALLDRAVEFGINRLRLEIRSGAENPEDFWSQWRSGAITNDQWRAARYRPTNDDADPNVVRPGGFQFSELDSTIEKVVLPMRQRVMAAGRPFHINLNFVDFMATNSTFDLADHPAEYAEFMSATFAHMQQRHGVVPDSVELVLEPNNPTGWTPAKLANALVAVGDRLKAEGHEPDFIGPSTSTISALTPWVNEMFAANPRVGEYLSEMAYHRYDAADNETTRLTAIGALAASKGLRTSMLEKIGVSHQGLHRDLKFANVSAWQQFTLAFPGAGDDGGAYFLIQNPTSPSATVVDGSRTRFLRHYFQYIEPGSVRIGATTSAAAFDPIAFIDEDGQFVIVLKADAAGSFSVQGLPAGTYGLIYTTALSTAVRLPDVTLAAGAPLNASIPSGGVMTIYAIPEPGVVGLLLLGGAALLRRAR